MSSTRNQRGRINSERGLPQTGAKGYGRPRPPGSSTRAPKPAARPLCQRGTGAERQGGAARRSRATGKKRPSCLHQVLQSGWADRRVPQTEGRGVTGLCPGCKSARGNGGFTQRSRLPGDLCAPHTHPPPSRPAPPGDAGWASKEPEDPVPNIGPLEIAIILVFLGHETVTPSRCPASTSGRGRPMTLL